MYLKRTDTTSFVGCPTLRDAGGKWNFAGQVSDTNPQVQIRRTSGGAPDSDRSSSDRLRVTVPDPSTLRRQTTKRESSDSLSSHGLLECDMSPEFLRFWSYVVKVSFVFTTYSSSSILPSLFGSSTITSEPDVWVLTEDGSQGSGGTQVLQEGVGQERLRT